MHSVKINFSYWLRLQSIKNQNSILPPSFEFNKKIFRNILNGQIPIRLSI